jgi:predicted HTH transcriptional regulator
MTLFYKRLEDVTEADLSAMINVQSELKTIEFKSKHPELKIIEAKAEFLRDACSFSNSMGGDILYGVKADKGVATEIPGLDITGEEADGIMGSMESTIREWIRPRINVTCQPLKLTNGKLVIIMRVHRGLMLSRAGQF